MNKSIRKLAESQADKDKKYRGVSQTKSTRQRRSQGRSKWQGDVVSSSVDPKNVPAYSGADQFFGGGSGRLSERVYVSAAKKGQWGPVKKVPKGAAITGVVFGYGGPGIGDNPTRFTFSKEYAKGAKKGSYRGPAMRGK